MATKKKGAAKKKPTTYPNQINRFTAPKGNRWWEMRSKHGSDKTFATPLLMLEAACEYFKWCDDNPFISVELSAGRAIELPKMRPYTLEGLTLFLDVNTVYFNHFATSIKDKKDSISTDFGKVIIKIREIIYNQKFSGAAAGFLNANIIARDLGLKDNKDLTSGGEKINTAEQVFKIGDVIIKL